MRSVQWTALFRLNPPAWAKLLRAHIMAQVSLGSVLGDRSLDILIDLLTFAVMMAGILLIISLLAGLFMIIFSIAVGVDERLQE
ncbi:hypothetical protein BH24CHL4_BH24CHL4_01770 [soil metagenome]